MPRTPAPEGTRTMHRVIGILFGAIFVALALLVVFASEAGTRLGSIAVALVLGGLGLDLILSTLRRKRSLLSRIGPLP